METFASRRLYLAKLSMLVGALVGDDQHYTHNKVQLKSGVI